MLNMLWGLRTLSSDEILPENKISGMKSESNNYTYILRCSDGSLYTGWTNNLEKRVKSHNLGIGAKYTKPRRPVELVYYETYPSKVDAMKRESEIKKLSKQKKEELIKVNCVLV